MCGRYATTRSEADLSDLFDALDVTEGLTPSWNVAPTDPVPLVRVSQSRDARVLDTARWGLVPPWATDLRGGARMINARSETVATSPAFAPSFARRRCLVPADGWFEWVRSGRDKQAFYMTPADGAPLAFAGIWSAWTPGSARGGKRQSSGGSAPGSEGQGSGGSARGGEGQGSGGSARGGEGQSSGGSANGGEGQRSGGSAPGGESQGSGESAPGGEGQGLSGSDRGGETRATSGGSLLTCSVLTTAAIGGLSRVHDRMPLILPRERWPEWLAGGGDPVELLRPMSERELAVIEVRPVGAAVGNVRNNGPHLLDPPVAATLF